MANLHFSLYNGGNAGLFNLLLSAENGYLMGLLTGRTVAYYDQAGLYLGNGLRLFDLVELPSTATYRPNATPDPGMAVLPGNLHTDVYFAGHAPTLAFLNCRAGQVDLGQFHGSSWPVDVRTATADTLGEYSYCFHLSRDQKRAVYPRLRNDLRPKARYVDAAQAISRQIRENYGDFYAIHVRRGDYMNVPGVRNGQATWAEMLPVVLANCPTDKLLVVHSDETNAAFFEPLRAHYPNLWLIDHDLASSWPNQAECGLVSALVAAESAGFVGTLYSTFTGFVQRQRQYSGKKEWFRYLYDQTGSGGMNLSARGQQKEASHGAHTWNRISWPDSNRGALFWARAWPEAWPDDTERQQCVRVVPDFVDADTAAYLCQLAQAETEYFAHENRYRVTVGTGDERVRNLTDRACRWLGYDPSLAECSLQIFRQLTGGQTHLHTDSVFEDEHGRRVASVLFYLNAGYTGSVLGFPRIGVRIQPQAGMLISYRLLDEYGEQDARWSHEAAPIETGEKIMAYFSMKEY